MQKDARLFFAQVSLTPAPSLLAFARKNPVKQKRRGITIEAYDAVAYFEDGKAVKGGPQFSHAWSGATWLFASAAHRVLFGADPERYASRFGGYCSYAVAHGYTTSGDPEAWTIYQGKLYLNYNKSVRRKMAGQQGRVHPTR